MDCAIRLRDVEMRTVKVPHTGHTSQIKSLAFSPDGTILAGRSYDSPGRLCAVATGNGKATLTGGEFSIDNLSFAGRWFKQNSFFWDIETGVVKWKLTGQ